MIDLRTLHLGPDELLIVAELTISPKATSSDYEVIDQLEQEIRTVLAPKNIYLLRDRKTAARTGKTDSMREEDLKGIGFTKQWLVFL